MDAAVAFSVLRLVWALVLVFLFKFGIQYMLFLAIDIAAKLEPGPKHRRQIAAHKENAPTISLVFAGGLVGLAWFVGLVASGS